MDSERSYKKYLIPAALAFVVGFVLWQIQRDRQEMTYELVESEAFPREGGIGRYFIVRLENSGNRPVESIHFQLSLSEGLIDLVRFSSPDLVSQQQTDSASVTCTIPLLNPEEVLSVTITGSGRDNISSPKILARARGTTALPKSKNAIPYSVILLVAGAILAFVVSVGFSWFVQVRSSESLSAASKLGDVTKGLKEQAEDLKKTLEEVKQGKPDREQLIFVLLNRSGLGHLVPEILSTGDTVSFWKTGLVLMHSFLLDESNQEKYVEAMNTLVSLPMAPSSRGSNLYLLAKMEQFRGRTDDALKYLETCKKETPAMYEHLIAQDISYDLHKLQEWLRRKTQKETDGAA